MTWLEIWRWVLDLGWLVILLILLRHFWRDRQSLVQARTWLQVKGRITSCELTKSGHSVWPKIEYTYEVYEKEMIGEHLFLDTTHNNPNSKYARHIAYKAALAFKEGEEVEVYYNPNHPGQSALDVTMPKKLTFILVLISILLVFQGGFIVWRLFNL
jgi:uncharacterized protein YxeA